MSLSTNVSNLATRIATEVKLTKTQINGNAADLSALTTTTKTNLVAAINEVVSQLGPGINDATTATTSVWSSSKTSSEIAGAVSALVGTAPATLDTLSELAAALNDNPDQIDSILTTLSTKANTSDVVLLSGNQTVAGIKTFSSAPVVPDGSFTIAKTSGLQNAIDLKANSADVGSTTTNYVATFEAGLI